MAALVKLFSFIVAVHAWFYQDANGPEGQFLSKFLSPRAIHLLIQWSMRDAHTALSLNSLGSSFIHGVFLTDSLSPPTEYHISTKFLSVGNRILSSLAEILKWLISNPYGCHPKYGTFYNNTRQWSSYLKGDVSEDARDDEMWKRVERGEAD